MDTLNSYCISEEQFTTGSLGCRGCGWSLSARHFSQILGKDTVYVIPACCFSIIVGPYPLNAMKANIVHTLFAAAPATATGVRAALDRRGKHDATVCVLAGDGGTFDIGLQAMSGAAARGENILYICNNNGAYMNTGIQSSTATPYGAATTTNPNPGFRELWPKDLMGIVAAHNIPYLATASLAHLDDFRNKIEKAKDVKGFRMIMIDGPCPPGHKTDPAQSIELGRLAVETRLFPLYEVIDGHYHISYKPEEFVPVEACMKLQGRFKHIFKNDRQDIISKVQDYTDRYWRRLEIFETIEEKV